MKRELAEGVVDARHLAVHGPPGDDAHLVVLRDAQDDVVLQHVQRVVHGVHSQVCGPLQTHLQKPQHMSEIVFIFARFSYIYSIFVIT